MNPFDAAIAVETAGTLDSDLVEWEGELTEDWSIGSIPNGGYSSAILLGAMLQHTGQPVARSLTNHYYRRAIHGAPCQVITEIRKRGRTLTHCDATLVQGGKEIVRSVGIFGDYPPSDVASPIVASKIAPPQDCVLRDPGIQGFHMSLLDSLEVRIDPTINESIGNPDAEPRFEGWVRFVEPRPNDALALALFADAFPPAIVVPQPEAGWVPTVELTTHIRAQAADGWIRAQIKTNNIRGGTLLEDAHLWDETGALVAQSRQLAFLLK